VPRPTLSVQAGGLGKGLVVAGLLTTGAGSRRDNHARAAAHRQRQSMPVVIKPLNPGTAAAGSVVACATMHAGPVIIGCGSGCGSGSTACLTLSSVAPGQRVNRTLTVRAVTARQLTRAITGTARADALARATARPARVGLLPAVGRPRVTGQAPTARGPLR